MNAYVLESLFIVVSMKNRDSLYVLCFFMIES